MTPWILLSLVAVNIDAISPGVPNRQPQLAAAHGLVAMTFAAGPAIYFASSSDNGFTFSRPVKVADLKILAVGRHRGPRVAILKDAIVITAVAGEKSGGEHSHGLPADGDLLTWRSVDRGKSWSRGAVVNDVPGAAREGLHAMTADARGNLFAAWLDLRAAGTQLFGSRSTDGGATWSRNELIYASPDGTICQCCHPVLAVDDRGRVSVMWRNVLQGSRDLYLSTSEDGVRFGAARKLGDGTWKINACPMDGGGIAFDRGEIVTAWRREGRIFLSRPGQPETDVGAGKDVAIATGKKGVFLVWNSGPVLELLRPGATTPLRLAPSGGFANLVTLPGGTVLAAWEYAGTIATRRLD